MTTIPTAYTITHACRHEELHEIRQGSAKRRQWIAKRRATKPCSKCSRIAWQADVDTTNAYYTELAIEHELPQLVGTDRQLPWATGLRGEFLDQVDEHAPGFRALLAEHGRPYHEGARDVIREFVLAHTDAAWWIEHRKQLVTTLVREHRRGLKFSGAAGDTAKGLLLYLDTVR